MKVITYRAQMGAYYTKEDITDYISKNCIIPWLFDETARQYPKAFAATGEIWQQLRESGDTYIYPAVKHGVSEALPKEISVGIKDVAKRGDWNKPAPANYALPTEIWREVVERRKRYEEVAEKIKSGGITNINDFITYNLNIRQFAQDVIQNTNDPDFLKAFYKALNNVTIIDPTCGSGAFLFAAMNILEPLYEACLQRMEIFLQEAQDKDALAKLPPELKKSWQSLNHPKSRFRLTLDYVNAPEHPNRAYFIYKNIILCNLYGVDIMKEAVEIAKLRLFLKLVATVEADYRKPNLGLEPLPDIDFNIRAGNTLIGFATEDELKKGLRYTLDGVAAAPVIEEKCDIVAKAFTRYKQIQLSYGDDFREFKKAKENLNKRLKELNKELNKLLHKQAEGIKYDQWLETHQPFHWFAEFYEIIQDRKGFDVIIGNPPYVEYSKVKPIYSVQNYATLKTGNLYSFCIERSALLCSKKGYFGMIVPLSSVANKSMLELQTFLKKKSNLYISNYHERPAQLFAGVLQRLSIILFQNNPDNKNCFTTPIMRWQAHTRDLLFSMFSYTKTDQSQFEYFIKLGNRIETSILEKFVRHSTIAKYLDGNPKRLKNFISYRTAGGGYWRTFLNVQIETSSLSNKTTSFASDFNATVFSTVLNSNLFWWYYFISYDVFNTKDYMIFSFRFNYPTDKNFEKKLIEIGKKLQRDLLDNREKRTIVSKTKGANETIVFRQYKSKELIDQVDKLLAKHYGFSAEEVDFLINYDIKYRMSNVELEAEV